MGFFKKIFKPIRKVLDKVVPNEVKPLLPYAAAFAPMLAPGMFGAGASGLGGLFSQNPIIQRAIMGGALNIGSTLSQGALVGDLCSSGFNITYINLYIYIYDYEIY